MNGTVVSLRYVTGADEPFLQALFTSTHRAEFAGLDETVADELQAQQYRAQHESYRAQFDPAGDHIIEEHGRPVGRLWVHCVDTEWRLVDIAVLPERQQHGIARALLDDLTAQADEHSATLRLAVRIDNLGALRLYFRHGFATESASETHLSMKRLPVSTRLDRFERFRVVVRSDARLQARLREIGRNQLVDEIVAVAAELGLELEYDDVRTARDHAPVDWLDELL